jgi:hypothetical protein
MLKMYSFSEHDKIFDFIFKLDYEYFFGSPFSYLI